MALKDLKDTPLISIIIPVYNAEKYIEETIENILSQTYKNYEILVIDDCSNDRSVQIIKKLAEQHECITLIESEVNFGGPAKPRNIGVENANGEYLAFLDADDLWTRDKLQKQFTYMLDNHLNFSSTGKVNIDEYSNEINFKANILAKINSRNSKKNICDLIKYRFIFTSSVIVSSDLNVYFDESHKYKAVEDLCAWLNLFRQSKTQYGYIENRILKYRILEQSISARNIEFKHATKAYICILNFILKYEMYENMKCFYKACARDFSLNFLQKTMGKNK